MTTLITDMQRFTTRSADLLKDADRNRKIYVFGAGSVGSYACMSLVRMGYENIEVFDYDTVGTENIGNQYFGMNDVGQLKVKALQARILNDTGIKIRATELKIEKNALTLTTLASIKPDAIVVMAVDCMDVRKFIVEKIKANRAHCFLVDTRMAIQYLTQYFFTSHVESCDHYLNTIVTNANAIQEACTNKAVAFTSLMAGSLVAKAVFQASKLTFGAEATFGHLVFDIRDYDMMITHATVEQRFL